MIPIEKKIRSKIEWVNKTDGDLIRFGLVEGFDKEGNLQYTKRMVITDYNIKKVKYPKIRITEEMSWKRR